MEDREIVQLYWDRSEKAVFETGARYGRYCRAVADRILQDTRDAEECVNDAYLRAWNAIPPARPADLRTYMGKIVRNLALNRWEKRNAEKRGAGQVPLALEELAECLPATDDVERAAEDGVVRDALDHFLAALPERTRKVFVRRYWYLSSVREIAKDYGMSESAVTVTLFRTRSKLKTALEEEGIIL